MDIMEKLVMMDINLISLLVFSLSLDSLSPLSFSPFPFSFLSFLYLLLPSPFSLTKIPLVDSLDISSAYPLQRSANIQSELIDELVVFEYSQALPQYIIYLKD